MKLRQNGFLIMLFLALLGGLAGYWYSIRYQRLSTADFLQTANSINLLFSEPGTEYAGSRKGRVFIKHRHMDRFPEYVTYWTDMDELPPYVVDAILAGTGRWERASNR